MEKNVSVLKILEEICTIFGVTTILLDVFCLLFGTSAYGFSSIFSLGERGVSIQTSLQFLLAVTIIILWKTLFMTDMVIRHMSTPVRITLLFAGAFATILVFVFLFDWFPADMPLAWVMFFLCFVISCSVSTLVSTLAERQENRRLETALKHYKEQRSDTTIKMESEELEHDKQR